MAGNEIVMREREREREIVGGCGGAIVHILEGMKNGLKRVREEEIKIKRGHN